MVLQVFIHQRVEEHSSGLGGICMINILLKKNKLGGEIRDEEARLKQNYSV